MKFTKEDAKAILTRYDYLVEWVENRLDSMYGEETRYDVRIEFDSSCDVEINWTDSRSDHQDVKVSWAELEDETDETFTAKQRERQDIVDAYIEKRNRERAERELRAAEREYRRARTAATDVGVA